MSPYHEELSEFRRSYSKACALVSCALVLMGCGLDLMLYPARFEDFLLARLVLVGGTLAVYAVLRTDLGLRLVRPLTLLWLSLPQLMISWMIWKTDGVNSIYFVGLHLALYATGIILPITLFECMAFGFFTTGLYFAACWFHPGGITDPAKFAGYSLFILLATLLSAFCTYFNERGRMLLFELKREIGEKNAALQRTNAALAEIKGHMIQQEKMAALGTLSAGLLHEVNNPVNYSLMAMSMALTDPAVDGKPPLKEMLLDAEEGMDRVKRIVSDLKTFAYQRPDAEANRVFLFENAVNSALRLAGYELKGIEVRSDLPQDTHVCGDEPAIIGVLINLLSNASMAIRAASPTAPRLDIRARHGDGRLHVAVRDNGTGIRPEHLTRVFEPFFTMRDVGQGLGLGLSVSYAIVQRHGSTLAVNSELGAWTEFSFDLAQAPGHAGPAGAAGSEPAPSHPAFAALPDD